MKIAVGRLGDQTTLHRVTIFSIVDLDDPEFCSKTTEDILHMETNQGLVYEVYFTQDDIDAVHGEPSNFPVWIASAAKRQRSEVKVKDLSPEELKQFHAAK